MPLGGLPSCKLLLSRCCCSAKACVGLQLVIQPQAATTSAGSDAAGYTSIAWASMCQQPCRPVMQVCRKHQWALKPDGGAFENTWVFITHTETRLSAAAAALHDMLASCPACTTQVLSRSDPRVAVVGGEVGIVPSGQLHLAISCLHSHLALHDKDESAARGGGRGGGVQWWDGLLSNPALITHAVSV